MNSNRTGGDEDSDEVEEVLNVVKSTHFVRWTTVVRPGRRCSRRSAPSTSTVLFLVGDAMHGSWGLSCSHMLLGAGSCLYKVQGNIKSSNDLGGMLVTGSGWVQHDEILWVKVV